MTKQFTAPTPWKDDPTCGHLVRRASQSHYCTYIRLTRLLALCPKRPTIRDLTALTTAQSWILWEKVLARDLAEIRLCSPNASCRDWRRYVRRSASVLRILHAQLSIEARLATVDTAQSREPASAGAKSKLEWIKCGANAHAKELASALARIIRET